MGQEILESQCLELLVALMIVPQNSMKMGHYFLTKNYFLFVKKLLKKESLIELDISSFHSPLFETEALHLDLIIFQSFL